jgi:hypothetical protein
MQIRISSVMVDNQDTVLRFYTTILGFEKKPFVRQKARKVLSCCLNPWVLPLLRYITRLCLPRAFRPRRLSPMTYEKHGPNHFSPVRGHVRQGNLINLVQPVA